MEHPSGISARLSKTLEMVLGLLRSSLTPSDLALSPGSPLIMPAHVQAARVWSAAEALLKMTLGLLGVCVGGSGTVRSTDEMGPPPSCCSHEGH